MMNKLSTLFKFLIAVVLFMVTAGCGLFHPYHSSHDYDRLWDGVQRTVLPNGLTLVTQEIHSAPVVSVYIYYKVGSRDEGPGEHGISHLLEHMMFKSTSHMKDGDFDRLIVGVGGSYNANTSRDFTSYHETLPAGALETALKVEADRMENLRIDSTELAHEKTVVLSELQGKENDPALRLDKAVKAAVFQAHPYHNPTIGYPDEIRSLTAAQVENYYHEHYAPNNAVLVVTGDFKTADLRKTVDHLFRGKVRRPITSHPITPEPVQTEEHRLQLSGPGKTSYVEIDYHIPSASSRDHLVMEVISSILSGGANGRLPLDLLDRNIITDHNAAAPELMDPYVFEVTAAPASGHSFNEVEDSLELELHRLTAAPVPAEELHRVIQHLTAKVIYGLDDIADRASILGFYNALDQETVPGSYLNTLQSITPADIQRVAQRYFRVENRTVGWLSGSGTGALVAEGKDATHSAGAVEEAPGAQSASTEAPAINPSGMRSTLAALQAHPPVILKTLPNGLVVLICPNHASPDISVACSIRAGSIYDDPAKASTAHFALYGVHWGTEKRSGIELASQLDAVGATITPRAKKETANFMCRCLSEDLPVLLDILSDEIRNPAYGRSMISDARRLSNSLELKDRENPTISAKTGFLAALYPADSPQHWNEPGSPETRGRITNDDLRRFHAAYYRPERTTLVIVGDIEPDEALNQVTRWFGGWVQAGKAGPEAPALPPAFRGFHRVFQSIPGAEESRVVMGFPGIERSSPDFAAADAANLILGGSYGLNRLHKRLRKQQGMVYDIYSSWDAGRIAGPWSVDFGSSPSNVDRSVADVLSEMKVMQQQAISAAELDFFKNWAIGRGAIELRTNELLADQLLYAEMNGLTPDFPWQYPAILAAVTPEQVQQAARKHFHPEDMVVSMAGPAT